MIRRSFTLMEVLLAVALVLMLSGAVYGFLWNLLGQRDRVESTAEEASAATAIIERIESDLMGSLAGAAGEAGIKGTTGSLRLLSRQVGVPLDKASRGALHGDLFCTEVAFNPSSGEITARRWNMAGEGSAGAEVVGDGVQRLRFRYFDGRRWRAAFDSAAEGELPCAVEVALWFGSPEQGEMDAEGAESPQRPQRRQEPGEEARAGDGGNDAAGSVGEAPATPDREPDRVRVMVVPDGPRSEWRTPT